MVPLGDTSFTRLLLISWEFYSLDYWVITPKCLLLYTGPSWSVISGLVVLLQSEGLVSRLGNYSIDRSVSNREVPVSMPTRYGYIISDQKWSCSFRIISDTDPEGFGGLGGLPRNGFRIAPVLPRLSILWQNLSKSVLRFWLSEILIN